MSSWQVKLPRFEGPLDLLLFLVSKQEYDIMDLPMAEITESYLAVIDTIGIDNLEDAGDYLLMAATLLAIKVQMMLPRPKIEAIETEEGVDPRQELARRLLLYQKVKEEADNFSELEHKMFNRLDMTMNAVPPMPALPPEETLFPMTIYDLAKAIEDIQRRHGQITIHRVNLFRTSIQERMEWIKNLLNDLEQVELMRNLREEPNRIVWIVTLLAILDMAKMQYIHVDQNEPFTEIYITRAKKPEMQAA